MAWLLALRDTIVALGPFIAKICQAMKDRELRELTARLIRAKTEEDKRAIAADIASRMFHPKT